MSEVLDEVKQEVQKVEAEVKQYFAVEKAHLQEFLNYLAKQPYDQVFQLVEKMKLSRSVNLIDTPAAAPVVDPTPAPVAIAPVPADASATDSTAPTQS
jgi:hypothetical protein